MKITTHPLENHQTVLTIELDNKRMQKEMRRAARHLSKQVNIPGFRPGRAPYDRVLAYLGEQTIREEVAQSLAEDLFEEALEETGLSPYSLGDLQIPSYDPLTLQLTISLRPEVNLGDYHSYRLEHRPPQVSQDEIDAELETLRHDNIILEPVERPAAPDDVVEVNIVGRTAAGEIFMNEQETQITLYDEEAITLPALYDYIVGMSVGETRTITLTIPDDFYADKLRGQEAEFTIELLETYEQILPAIDDDLARTVGNFDSLEELEAHIAGLLLESKIQQADEEYSQQVFGHIVAQAEVKYPPEMLEEVLDDMLEDYAEYIERQTHLPFEKYIRLQGESRESLRQQFRPDAVETLKRSLVAWEIIEREGLEISDEEITQEIERIVLETGGDSDVLRSALNTENSRRALRDRLLHDKLLKHLAAIARGEAPEQPPAHRETEAGDE